MKTTLQIAIYQFKSLFRNFKQNAIMFVLPVVFMGIFGLVFGSDVDTTYKIGLVKSDAESYNLVKDNVLSEMTVSETSDQKLFEIFEYDNYDDALVAVQDGNVSAVVQVPPNFYPNMYDAPVIVSGVPTSSSFGAITSILRTSLGGYLEIKQDYLSVEFTKEYDEEGFSAFDFIAPGMMVYGILILIPGVANNFVSIVEKKYIFRYFTSKVKAWEIILGNTIYQMFIALVNIILLYFSAVMFGFNAEGGLGIGLLVGLLTALFVVGLGLLIGAFSTETESATNTGTIFSVILGFLSGSFIAGIGQVLQFDLFGKTYQFNDFLPSKWATVALEKVLRDGKGIEEITTEILIIAVSSVIVLGLGIVTYYRKHLRRLE